MPQPAARQNDTVTGTDIHIVLVPSPSGTVPTPTPHPFFGRLTAGCRLTCRSTAWQQPPRAASPRTTARTCPIGGPSFASPPTNQGRVLMGSPTVLVNSKPLARQGDSVATCNDPVDAPTSTITTGSRM